MSKALGSQKAAEHYRAEMVGKRYRHFKGGIYIVTDIAVNTETEGVMVVYKDIENPSLVWARPMRIFLSEVDKNKYPDVKQERKFEELVK